MHDIKYHAGGDDVCYSVVADGRDDNPIAHVLFLYTTKGHVEEQHRVSKKNPTNDTGVDDAARNDEQQKEPVHPSLVAEDPNTGTAQEEAVSGQIKQDHLKDVGVFTAKIAEEKADKVIHG